MKTATATLTSISAYSQSQQLNSAPEPNESYDDYEARIWRSRAHVNPDGVVFIPPMAIKKAMDRAAVMLGMKVKGGGGATYTKHFKAGALITDGIPLGITAEQLQPETRWMLSNPTNPKSGKVQRTYPVIPEWSGHLKIYVIDDKLTEDVVRTHLEKAGHLVGIGRFRPENGGFYGRFTVSDFQWSAAL